MARATSSTSSGAQSKSGNPCERLMAPHSAARRDISAKMLTPPAGSLLVSTGADDILVIIAREFRRPPCGYGTRPGGRPPGISPECTRRHASPGGSVLAGRVLFMPLLRLLVLALDIATVLVLPAMAI